MIPSPPTAPGTVTEPPGPERAVLADGELVDYPGCTCLNADIAAGDRRVDRATVCRGRAAIDDPGVVAADQKVMAALVGIVVVFGMQRDPGPGAVEGLLLPRRAEQVCPAVAGTSAAIS